MLLKIDFESEVAIYTQLRNQIVEGIARGFLKDGDNLPSVRQLAEDIGINLHTVNKAYNVLKTEGFLKLDRRKGAYISLNFNDSKEELLHKLEDEMRPILSEAFCKRIKKDEIIEVINKFYKEYEGDEV